jgi:hypothetical protein
LPDEVFLFQGLFKGIFLMPNGQKFLFHWMIGFGDALEKVHPGSFSHAKVIVIVSGKFVWNRDSALEYGIKEPA